MNMSNLQLSHRGAVLNNLATGELYQLEHREAVLGDIATGELHQPAGPAASAGPAAGLLPADELVAGQYACPVKVEGKLAHGDYQRIN